MASAVTSAPVTINAFTYSTGTEPFDPYATAKTSTASTSYSFAYSALSNTFVAFSAWSRPGTYTIENIQQISRTINASEANSTLDTSSGMIISINTTAIIPNPGVAAEYLQLSEALNQLHGLEEDDDWKINSQVYAASIQVAATLMEYDIPRPGVFTHGPNSVVFNWSQEQKNLYLTISKNQLSVLVSSSEGIELQTNVSTIEDATGERFISALRSVPLLSPPQSFSDVVK